MLQASNIVWIRIIAPNALRISAERQGIALGLKLQNHNVVGLTSFEDRTWEVERLLWPNSPCLQNCQYTLVVTHLDKECSTMIQTDSNGNQQLTISSKAEAVDPHHSLHSIGNSYKRIKLGGSRVIGTQTERSREKSRSLYN